MALAVESPYLSLEDFVQMPEWPNYRVIEVALKEVNDRLLWRKPRSGDVENKDWEFNDVEWCQSYLVRDHDLPCSISYL